MIFEINREGVDRWMDDDDTLAGMMILRGYLEKHRVTVDFPETFSITTTPVSMGSFYPLLGRKLCPTCY